MTLGLKPEWGESVTIFTCAPDWESMLTCIYDAWASRLGHANVRLKLEPIEEYTIFDRFVHVEGDHGKAESVMDAVNRKISPEFYNDMAFCAMAYEPDTLDTIYRMMVLGFKYGPCVLQMEQFEVVSRFRQIRKRVGGEAHHFREFLRFHEVRSSLYVAHIEPKSRIVVTLGDPFEDRMPSENWMIIDDVHKEAVIHPKNEHFYLRTLTDEEFKVLLETEKENDEFTDMWKVFFDSIAIKERENYRCQRNLFPIWKRKHAVEFTA